MSWTNVAFLLVGIGIGAIAARSAWGSKRRRPYHAVTSTDPLLDVVPSTSEPQSTLHVADPPTSLSSEGQALQVAYAVGLEMAQFKSGFLARSSHELRSPINTVISLHQLILSDLCESPEEERECVVQSLDAARRMLAILDELVTVSKTECGAVSLQIQPVQLAYTLQQVHLLTHLIAQNRNLRLEIQQPDPSLYVLADPRRFQQVLVSLVDMAIAQMDEGSIRITVQPDLSQGWVHLWLEDDRPDHAWSELIDLMQQVESPQGAIAVSAVPMLKTPDSQPIRYPLPPGLSLFTAKTLMTLMQGKLELQAVSPDQVLAPDAATSLPNRLQCSIPLAADELTIPVS